MGLQEAINNIWSSDYVQTNPRKSYKNQYPAEYATVSGFLNGGAVPSNWQSFSKMGKGLVEAEIERRGEVIPPPSEWTTVAAENASFTLTENKEVRYGKDPNWTSKILGPGTYKCDNATFGDPFQGTVKHCEAKPTSQTPPPPPPPPPPTTGIQYAVNASDWYDASHNPNLVKNLGAKVVREARSAPISSGDVKRYTDVGIKLLWEINVGASASSVTSALQANAGAFFGVEYGNEDAFAHNNPNWSSPTPGSYAQGAKAVGQACKAAGVPFGIQIGSDALRGAIWVDGLYAAVSDLNNYFDAWIIHPYGPPHGTSRATGMMYGDDQVQRALDDATRHGSAGKDWWITEFGIAFAYPNKIALQPHNYGWALDMSPQEAADGLLASEAMWKQKLGGKLKFVSIYHDFDTHGTGDQRESYFGTVKADGSTKGAYTTTVKQRLST
jgi:hypothetical protein